MSILIRPFSFSPLRLRQWLRLHLQQQLSRGLLRRLRSNRSCWYVSPLSFTSPANTSFTGNAVVRSIMGACLPLAGGKLYESLGSNWAGTLLGLIEVACIPIPVVFYLYGGRIRERSAMIRRLQEDKLRMQVKEVIPVEPRIPIKADKVESE